MAIANDIIGGALRLISSLTPGEAVNGAEASNALTVLNRLLAAFSMEWDLINTTVIEPFPLIINQISYTYGVGGNLNSIRPDTIVNQWIYDTVAGIRYPLKQVSDWEYNWITLNTIGSIPKVIYYDPQFPLGVLYIYPVAGGSNYQLNIESKKPMAQFATTASSMNLPGEYYEELVMLLADELSVEYGFEMPQKLQQKIDRVRELMKARNFKRTVATFDPAINGGTRYGTILDGFAST